MMNKTTKTNLREWITNNLNYFPNGFLVDDFDALSWDTQEEILKRLLKAFNTGRRNFKRTNDTLSKRDIAVIDISLIKFTVTLTKKLERQVARRIIANKPNEPIDWADVNPSLANNFKNWVRKYKKNFDEEFTMDAFIELPDTIKVEWLMLLVKKFGYKYYEDLETAKISVADMVSGVKNMKLPPEIQNAIYDVTPVASILQTINRSDMDGWDAQSATEFAKGLSQEEKQALRDGRKADKKRAKMLARARSVKNLAGYQTMFDDELFDRDMLNIILNRMENRTAFKGTWQEPDSKDIIKLIVNNPLTTTKDLQKIQKVKTSYGSLPEYNSQHLNAALSSKDDLPESELMKLVKKSQFDVKLNASKRELASANKQILIDYTVKHHAHMPTQLKEIFVNLGVVPEDYKDEIIKNMYKKYSSDKWKSNGLKTLEIIDTYGWLSDIPEIYKHNIVKVNVKAYDTNRVSKERLVKVINELSSAGMNYLTELYDATGDDDFIPQEAQDIFLF